MPPENGRCTAEHRDSRTTPTGKNHVLFYEYFHGDNGARHRRKPPDRLDGIGREVDSAVGRVTKLKDDIEEPRCENQHPRLPEPGPRTQSRMARDKRAWRILVRHRRGSQHPPVSRTLTDCAHAAERTVRAGESGGRVARSRRAILPALHQLLSRRCPSVRLSVLYRVHCRSLANLDIRVPQHNRPT